MVSRSEYTWNVPLTEGAIAANQDINNFVCDKAAPASLVTSQTGNYKLWSVDDLLRDEVELVNPGSEFPFTTTSLTTGTYSTEKYGLDEPVDWEAIEEFGGNILQDVANFLYKKALIAKDRDFAATYLTTSVFANDKQGNGNDFTSWHETDSNPIGDVESYKALVEDVYGLPINSMVITSDVVRALCQNQDILDRLATDTVRILRPEQLAALFGVDEVQVLKAVSNTSKKSNSTQTKAAISTGKVLLQHKGGPSPYEPSATRMFVRNFGDLDARGVGIYMLDDVSKESTNVRVKSRYDLVVPCSYLGVYLYDVIS